MEKKNLYSSCFRGRGCSLLVLKRGVMLAALEVDGAHKGPQSGVFKMD